MADLKRNIGIQSGLENIINIRPTDLIPISGAIFFFYRYCTEKEPMRGSDVRKVFLNTTLMVTYHTIMAFGMYKSISNF